MAEDRVEQLVVESQHFIRSRMQLLCSHWREMYDLSPKLIDHYCSKVQLNLEVMFQDMQTQVEEKKASMVEEIESKLKEHEQLQMELSMTIEQRVSADQPLQIIIKSLDSQLEQYRNMRAERIKVLKELQDKERELCDFLAEAPVVVLNTVPSDAQLEEIQANLHRLQTVKVDRSNRYRNLKLQIKHVMDVLEAEPANGFEEEAVGDDESQFRLTLANLNRLEEALRVYENRLEDRKEQIELLKNKLVTLWTRINEDESHRENFLAECTGIGQSTITKLLCEIDRCDEIKRANIKPCIESLRRDIADLWEKLAFSEIEKSTFGAFRTDTFNEDVLDLHELEYSRLEALYITCKDILDKARKRNLLRDRMLHLQRQATNPSRLKNRGGQLLKEEKERKSLEKSLPRIEIQLKNALVNYYQQHGKPFLFYGQDLLQEITNQTLRPPSSTVGTPRATSRGTPRATPSREISRSLSEVSVATYSDFEHQIEIASCQPTPSKRKTPQAASSKRHLTTPINTRSASRLPLRQVQPSPYRAHSSPSTPKRTAIFKPKPSPRRITPRRL